METLNTEMFLVTYFTTFFLIHVVLLFAFGLWLKKVASRKKRTFNWYMRVMYAQLRPSLFYQNCQRFELTKTEIRIARMLLEGKKNREIADATCRAEETIKKHVQNIFRKCGATNRVGLGNALQEQPVKENLWCRHFQFY